MILVLLLFWLPAGADELTRANVTQDRILTLQQTAESVKKTDEYRILSEKLDSLNQRVTELENPEAVNTKKNVIKTIGYTSSTIGLISSIWGIYEKSLSLKNSATDLEIRLNTRTNITADIERFKAMPPSPENTFTMNKKIEALGEINEKITNINMRIRISRLGLNRGIFKGVSSLGLFVLTFFIDDISLFFEKKIMSEKSVAANFLAGWNMRIIEAGIFPTEAQKYTPEEKSLFYFADSQNLGISEDAFLDALYEYKMRNPNGYAALRATASRQLYNILVDNIYGEINYLDLKEIGEIFKYDQMYTCVPDATRVECIKRFQWINIEK